MLSLYPLRNRVYVRLSLTTAWTLASCAGVVASLLIGNVIRELGTAMTVVCGLSLLIGSGVATYGVAFNRYRLEWAGAWFAAFGLSPYLVALWLAVFVVDFGRISQAFVISSLVTFFLYRAAMCSAHAARLRALHHEAEVVFHAGDDGDDSGANDG